LISQKQLDAIKRKHLDIPYADRSPAQILDIFLPDPAPDDAPGRYPVVVHIHGGAFMFGTQRDDNLAPILRGLARGYAVVSVQYRMSGEARFPALIWDCKAAIRWIRAHADEYGFDAGKLAAWGPSAGGYLAAMLGVTTGAPAFEDLLQGNADHSSDVQAVIDWCGPAGGFLEMDEDYKESGIGSADHSEADSPESLIMGAPILTIPELAALAAPCRYAHRDIPPFLIMHGEADPVVPVQQSVRLATALREKAGSEKVSLKTYPGKGHHGDPWYDEPEISDRCFDFLDEVFERQEMIRVKDGSCD
jgi:acetyl esterase/lipase